MSGPKLFGIPCVNYIKKILTGLNRDIFRVVFPKCYSMFLQDAVSRPLNSAIFALDLPVRSTLLGQWDLRRVIERRIHDVRRGCLSEACVAAGAARGCRRAGYSHRSGYEVLSRNISQ